MKWRAVILIAFLAIPPSIVSGQENPYRVVEGWAKLTDGRTWGSTSAVDVDANDHVWVAERCGANSCLGSNLAPILEFDQSGKLLRSFGAGLFVFPHGIAIDKEGNVWVTDGQGKEGKGHQVFKFSSDGRILMTLGKAGVAGNGPDEFNQPSDVIVGANGDIFVADGHGGNSNARIVKFSKDGKFIKTWGKKGIAPGEFDTPHGLALDSKGRLFVADRNNNRIQIFDQDGNYIEQWTQFSRPSGIFIDAKGQHLRRRLRIELGAPASRLEARHQSRPRERWLCDGVYSRPRRDHQRHERGGRCRRRFSGQYLWRGSWT